MRVVQLVSIEFNLLAKSCNKMCILRFIFITYEKIKTYSQYITKISLNNEKSTTAKKKKY